MSRNSQNPQDILSLNDSQIIAIASKVISLGEQNQEQSSSSISNSELAEIRNGWIALAKSAKELPQDKKTEAINHFNELLNRDMNKAEELFSQSSLGGNGDFANYVKRFANDDFVRCNQLMVLFFDCLCHIETKSQDEREQYFLEFPPISDDLNCLDGTFERITQAYLNLTVSKQNLPLLEVHEHVLRNLVDRLKDYVPSESHIHIPGYLSKVFGFAETATIYAESSIPAPELWKIYCDYADCFRDVLTGRDVLQKISKDFPGVDLNRFDINNSDLIKKIQNGLEPFKQKSETGFIQISDEGDFASINFDLLFEAANNMPASVALRGFMSDPDISSLADIKNDDNNLLAKLKNPAKISPNATIFSESFVENLIEILVRANDRSSNPQDLEFGLKALSIINNHHLISSSHDISTQVIDAIDSRTIGSANMPNEIKTKIFGAIINTERTNQIFLKDLSQMQFASEVDKSLKTNATTEKLVADILSDQNLPTSLNLNQNRCFEASLNLICRSDSDQIFDALKNKIGKEVYPNNHKFINQCFVIASELNKLDLCKKLNDDFHIDPEISKKHRLISRAARNGRIEMAEFLTSFAIKNNAAGEFSLTDTHGLTPAGETAYAGKEKIIQIFYQSGIDHDIINIPINTSFGESDLTPLDMATIRGNTNIVRFIFESGLCAKPSEDQIIGMIRKAAIHGHNHILKYLHDNVKVSPEFFDFKDNENYSAIELAAIKNHPETIELLDSYGVDIGQQYDDGASLLHIAAANKSCDVISFLCEKDMDPNYPDELGNTALHIAVINNGIDAIAILGQYQADATIQNHQGLTPIDIAIETKNDDAAIELLAIFNPKNGNSFLHEAVNDESKMLILENMIEAGINLQNLNPKNFNGETPLFLAAINGNRELISKLQNLGVDINCEDENGHTTIYHIANLQKNMPKKAFKGEAEKVLDFWLDCGADIKHHNHLGQTAFCDLIESNPKNISAITLLCKYQDRFEQSDLDLISQLSSSLQQTLSNNKIKQTQMEGESKSSTESKMTPEEKLIPRNSPSADSEPKPLSKANPKNDKQI